MKLNLKLIFTSANIIIPPESYSTNYKYSSSMELSFENVYNMFLMSYDSYYNINDTNWKKIPYNNTPINKIDIKGYIFSDEKSNINFISFKGTTLFGKEKFHDKFNDNLFYSCCFYKQSKMFDKYINKSNCVKDSKFNCNIDCFNDSKNFDLNYLKISKDLMKIIKPLLGDSQIIFTGYSLGGIIATFLGLEYSKQVITFDTPGNKHYFNLIGKSNLNNDNIYNFGHNADAIMNGNCGKLCWLFGYNVNTMCHVGKTCIFDAKKELKLSESINYHRLDYIDKYIIPEWKNKLPKCIFNTNCTENNCKEWTFT